MVVDSWQYYVVFGASRGVKWSVQNSSRKAWHCGVCLADGAL